MTSIIKLHTISGAMDESPPCYLLQVDEARILLDCGWDEKFNPQFIKEIKKYVHTIDAVLLSYPDPQHLGALPYLVGKLGLNCPIYATIPVYKMGQLFMYDLYMSHYNMSDFDLFTLDDVDTAFDRIIQTKYNQSVALKGKGYGITITPLPAGHMIGGTIWKIVKVGEEDIIYACDFNHKKERHLNGCELEKLQRPSLLIVDSFNAQYQQARRRARDEKLMTNILQTLRNNGNVMVTVDTAGRVLELAHMLDQLWKNKESGLMAYSLALLNNVSYNVVEFSKSQIEWMSSKLMKSFEGARNNPFQFRHVKLCHSMAELNNIPSPKVVLCSTPDIESGFSRELFMQWASGPTNSIILTTRTSPGTLARDLIDNGGNGRTIDLEYSRRVDLEGVELEEFLRTKGEKQVTKLLPSSKEADLVSSDSEDDLEMDVITGKHDIVIRPEGRSTLGFFKSNKRSHVMFPFHEERVKFDDYGEIVHLDDYKIADSGGDHHHQGESGDHHGHHGHNKENLQVKVEDIKKEEAEAEDAMMNIDKPTKVVASRRSVEVNAQIQFIDFEGRSDGESLLKILSQLRPRRVIIVRGTPSSTGFIAKYCKENLSAKVFAPQRGESIDATTESHIYQIKLTESLVSQLFFQKGGKDAEVTWIDAKVVQRHKQIEAGVADGDEDMEIDGNDQEKSDNDVLALGPMDDHDINPHDSVFLNELKLSDFKQVLTKHNIPSEFAGGVLWCSNGTLALKRVDTGKVSIEGCLSEDYYRVRQLLYEQYAIL